MRLSAESRYADFAEVPFGVRQHVAAFLDATCRVEPKRGRVRALQIREPRADSRRLPRLRAAQTDGQAARIAFGDEQIGFAHAQVRLNDAPTGFCHAQFRWQPAQAGFAPARIDFCHAQVRFRHAQVGFHHAQVGFRHAQVAGAPARAGARFAWDGLDQAQLACFQRVPDMPFPGCLSGGGSLICPDRSGMKRGR